MEMFRIVIELIPWRIFWKNITWKNQSLEDSTIWARVTNPDVIKKALRKKGDKVYVKWLAFDNLHNSWIHKNNVYKNKIYYKLYNSFFLCKYIYIYIKYTQTY